MVNDLSHISISRYVWLSLHGPCILNYILSSSVTNVCVYFYHGRIYCKKSTKMLVFSFHL